MWGLYPLMGVHPHIGCIPPHGGISPYVRVPPIWGYTHKWGQYHIPGSVYRWGCLPKYQGTRVYGNAFPYTGATHIYGSAFSSTRVPQYMGMHSYLPGYPSIWVGVGICQYAEGYLFMDPMKKYKQFKYSVFSVWACALHPRHPVCVVFLCSGIKNSQNCVRAIWGCTQQWTPQVVKNKKTLGTVSI
jgi:hypothetical protein